MCSFFRVILLELRLFSMELFSVLPKVPPSDRFDGLSMDPTCKRWSAVRNDSGRWSGTREELFSIKHLKLSKNRLCICICQAWPLHELPRPAILHLINSCELSTKRRSSDMASAEDLLQSAILIEVWNRSELHVGKQESEVERVR